MGKDAIRAIGFRLSQHFNRPTAFRTDIVTGAQHSFISIHDYGRYADAEVKKWLGLKSWKDSWGTEPRIVRPPRQQLG